MKVGARGTLAALMLALATGAAAQEQVSRGEAEFLRKAAESSLMEVELARLAKSKGTRAEVQQFAARMEQDHAGTYKAIEEIAASKRVTIPSAPPEKARDEAKELEEKMGPDFDRAYMRRMLDEHRDDIEMFERQAKNAEDPDIKALAGKTLLALRSHEAAARGTLDATLGSKRTGDRETGSTRH